MRKIITISLGIAIAVSLATSASANSSTHTTFGFCSFGSPGYQAVFVSDIFKETGPSAEWATRHEEIKNEFKTIVLKNFELGGSYDKSYIHCSWYGKRDRVEDVERKRTNGVEKYGNKYITDWVPGNSTITAKFYPKK